MENSSSNQTTYFLGCDMGGWHNKSATAGDAFAALRWDGSQLHHIEATAAVDFFPLAEGSPVVQCVAAAQSESARVIVGIDAALAWPARFRKMVAEVPNASHDFNFELGSAVDNPYLYRQTERFIKQMVQTGNTEQPLTAVGDKFGNNSSKAQALAHWFHCKLQDAYRPPFDTWDRTVAASKTNTIIEVYPAASMKSKPFKSLSWPAASQSMSQAGNNDIADAKRCAMSAFCYAVTLGIVSVDLPVPSVWLPDEATDSIDTSVISEEGWIFAPKAKLDRNIKK